jgi:two-component system, chemotaxis family, protein-glutamate methylesterase/glutaminase
VYKLIVIGTSLGGVTALRVLLSGLPTNFLVPIAIVQHRHRDSDNELSKFLQQQTPLPIREVEDKDELVAGHIYLAPADYHLLIESGYFSLSTDDPVSYSRPSIDVLFESAADAYAEQVIGVILTGANQDGAKGLAKIKARGGVAIVQEPSTAESPTMPEAALAELSRNFVATPTSDYRKTAVHNATIVDWVLPLTAIAPQLACLCHSIQD